MMKLEGSNVQLHARADTKADAIRKVGKLLVDSGHIKPGCIDSMLGRTVNAAAATGIWVGVCGGMAADPMGAVIPTGLGITELNVSIPSVAAVKAQLRRLALSDATSLADKALACRNAAAVRRLTSA